MQLQSSTVHGATLSAPASRGGALGPEVTDFVARKEGSAVVVVGNYRLGHLGFLWGYPIASALGPRRGARHGESESLQRQLIGIEMLGVRRSFKYFSGVFRTLWCQRFS